MKLKSNRKIAVITMADHVEKLWKQNFENKLYSKMMKKSHYNFFSETAKSCFYACLKWKISSLLSRYMTLNTL